ncbi:AUGMIN subunit 1 [Citrus sinensis]|nr:AUGMIN subunit 1 [Citrus sinensis]
MSDSVSLIDPPPTESRDAARIADVKAWLASQFEASAKEVPAFEYTSRSVAHFFLVAMGDISLRKTAVEEKRAKVQKESKILLDYTRKAIARLTYLKRTLGQLEDDVAPCEAQMENWKTNLAVMASKERQYLQQYNNYKALLNRVGYTPEISHGVLVEMAEHRKELEKKTKPILDTLRSYQDLPPDKALAALAIEDKKRQYAAAEKYLEDVLHSALATND